MDKKVLAIIVTYNRKQLLDEAISALLKQTYQELDILVVDNASTDGTKEHIQDLIDKKMVLYENTKKNIGGAGGFSYGVKYGVENNYDYLWLMDDDTIANETCLEELFKAEARLDIKYGFLCSYAEWIDGTPCVMNIPTLEKYWGEFLIYLDEKLLSVKTASFVSFLLKAEVVREVGLPIKEFFIWGDDTEYSRRISKKYPSFFVKDSKVIHKMGSNRSTDIYEETGDRLDRYKLLYRNRFYYGKKNGIKETLFYLNYVFESFIRIIKKSPDRKWKRIYLLMSGFARGVFFNPKIEFPL